MKVLIQEKHKMSGLDRRKKIDLLKIFYPLRPDVAKWQHQAIWYQRTFVILAAPLLVSLW
jgi:hypothetical protein